MRSRYRRDPSDLPPSLRTKKAAIARSIRKLGDARDLDTKERYAALQKIRTAIDKFERHGSYKEGVNVTELADRLWAEARAASEQASLNYREHLEREVARLRRAEHEEREKIDPATRAYMKELALTRRDAARRRRRR